MKPGHIASPGRKASNRLLRKWCKGVRGDVLSIGSGTDQDGQKGHYRNYFRKAASYTTSEPVPTHFCDRVLDVRSMPSVPDNSVDAIFCSCVLEHVDDVHAAVGECWRILKPGGVFLVGLPFNQPLHKVPQDFWRFTEYGIRYLLRAFTIQEIRPIGDVLTGKSHPITYWTRAIKPVSNAQEVAA